MQTEFRSSGSPASLDITAAQRGETQTLGQLQRDGVAGVSPATLVLARNLLHTMPRLRVDAFQGDPDAAHTVEDLAIEIVDDLLTEPSDASDPIRRRLLDHLPAERRPTAERLDEPEGLGGSLFVCASATTPLSLCNQRPF